MTIGFDGSRAFINKKTGTENYSYQLLKHLLQTDQTNNYKVYLRPKVRLSDPNFPLSSNQNLITIPFPRLWTQLGLALKTFTDPMDVLFVPSHTLPLLHRPGLKTVLTIHDLGAEYLPRMHQIKQLLYLKLMTHYQLRSATHLIAVSEATKKDLIKLVGIDPKKITVVYEGYNQELFKPIKGEALNNVLKQYKLVKDDYFLFVGTIQPRKNIERLIKAYAGYLKTGGATRGAKPNTRSAARMSDRADKRQDPSPRPKLILAGSKGWLAEEFYTLPKELGIKNQVQFLGFVPDGNLPARFLAVPKHFFTPLFLKVSACQFWRLLPVAARF